MRSLRFVTPLIVGLSCAVVPATGQAQVAVSVSVGFAPPALPIYVQPPMPAYGYVWTPGYWAWGPDGYYWVPGTWVLPPAAGLLWTPGYWAWENDAYVWIPGYWGPEVGFYGGIDYGFGYFGVGFVGGYWHEGHFFYNRDYNNFGHVHVNYAYSRRVEVRTSHVSFNGGAGGIAARPTAAQEAFARAAHTAPTALQMQHAQAAARERNLWATVNHGRPSVAATSEPGRFSGQGAVGARAAGAPYHPPVPAAQHPAGTPYHPAEPGAAQHPAGAPYHPAVPGAAPHPAGTGQAHPGYPVGGQPPGGMHPQPPVVTHGVGPVGHLQEPGRPVPPVAHPVAPPPHGEPGRPMPAAPHPEPMRPAAHPEAGRPSAPHPAEHQGERRDQQHP